MGKYRQRAKLVLALILVGGLSYCSYGYMSAESRLRELCAEIRPGMSFRELQDFSVQHGLHPPTNKVGMNYLVEKRTFGRYGCAVRLEDSVVKESRYNFAD